MLDPVQLQNFLYVLDSGTLSQAAHRAHLSQPALSRQIKLLEEELGSPLFERTGRGMKPNTAGRRLEPRARSIVEQLLGLRSEFHCSQVIGEVSFAVSPSVGMAWTARLLRDFRGRYPDVSVRVSVLLSGPMSSALSRGSIDVGVLYSPLPRSPLREVELWQEPTYFVCRREHRWAKQRSLDAKDALGVPLILPSSQHGIRAIAEQEARRLGAELKIELEVNSMQLALELVRQRTGNLLLSERALPDIQARRLAAVAVRRPSILRTAQLAASENALVRPAVRALWEFVLQRRASVKPETAGLEI